MWTPFYVKTSNPEGIIRLETGKGREPRIPGTWQSTRGAVKVVGAAGGPRAKARRRGFLPGVTVTHLPVMEEET